MSRYRNTAKVNSSFTSFFLLAIFITSFLSVRLFNELSHLSALAVALYALIFYFIWDFIKQLYNPLQSLILYVITFLLVPLFLNVAFDFQYGRLSGLVLLGSYTVAGIAELVYELVVKRAVPRGLLKRILLIDNHIDMSLLNFHAKQIMVSDYKGVVVALLIIAAYVGAAYLLLS